MLYLFRACTFLIKRTFNFNIFEYLNIFDISGALIYTWRFFFFFQHTLKVSKDQDMSEFISPGSCGPQCIAVFINSEKRP